jgi:hypothetical protein
MNPTKTVLGLGHPSDWRRYLLNPIVPQGEGPTEVVHLRVPKAVLADVDAIAKATDNPRSETLLHMIRWARDAYKAGVASELEASTSKKVRR